MSLGSGPFTCVTCGPALGPQRGTFRLCPCGRVSCLSCATLCVTHGLDCLPPHVCPDAACRAGCCQLEPCPICDKPMCDASKTGCDLCTLMACHTCMAPHLIACLRDVMEEDEEEEEKSDEEESDSEDERLDALQQRVQQARQPQPALRQRFRAIGHRMSSMSDAIVQHLRRVQAEEQQEEQQRQEERELDALFNYEPFKA